MRRRRRKEKADEAAERFALEWLLFYRLIDAVWMCGTPDMPQHINAAASFLEIKLRMHLWSVLRAKREENYWWKGW